MVTKKYKTKTSLSASVIESTEKPLPQLRFFDKLSDYQKLLQTTAHRLRILPSEQRNHNFTVFWYTSLSLTKWSVISSIICKENPSIQNETSPPNQIWWMMSPFFSVFSFCWTKRFNHIVWLLQTAASNWFYACILLFLMQAMFL